MSKRNISPSTSKEVHKKTKYNIFQNDIQASQTIFDDADDEYILSASQTLDIQCSASNSVYNFNANTQSTIENGKTENDHIMNLLLDDDDMVFPDAVFKVPESKTALAPSSSGHNVQREKAQEKKIHFLTNKLADKITEAQAFEKQCKELENKNRILENVKATLKKDIQSQLNISEMIRAEKNKEIGTIRNELLQKSVQISKERESLQMELEMKNVEILKLRTNKLNDTRTTESAEPRALDELNIKIPIFNAYTLDDSKNKKTINSQIYEKPISLQFGKLCEDSPNLVNCLIDIQNMLPIIRPNENDIQEELLIKFKLMATEFIKEFKHYSDTLEITIGNDAVIQFNIIVQSECESLDSMFCTLHVSSSENSIYQQKELFKNEEGILYRRILAAFVIVCRHSDSFIRGIFRDKIDECNGNSFIRTLGEILLRINHCRAVYNHAGIYTAAAELLVSLVPYGLHFEDLYCQLIKLLRAIIFSRSEQLRCLYSVSKFLLLILNPKYPNDIVNHLCKYSDDNFIKVNKSLPLIEFNSESSCTLQIYAAVLEVAVVQFKPLTPRNMQLLYKITLNSINFMKKCIVLRVKWFEDFLKFPHAPCSCFLSMANALIILIHLVMKQWIDNSTLIDLTSISIIMRAAVLLLNEILIMDTKKLGLKAGGTPLQYRIISIIHWLNDNSELFEFRPIHSIALKKIQNRLIVAEREPPVSIESSFITAEKENIFNSINF